MNCLIYCIFRGEEIGNPTPPLEGVGGESVFLVSEKELCAAVSLLPRLACTPGRDRLMAYKEVVDFFHRDRTVIPMRYGCFLEDVDCVRTFLNDRRAEYGVLLDQLAGCVEMGIRILMKEADDASGRGAVPHCPGTTQSTPGHSYLHARKAHFKQQELSQQARQRAVKQSRAGFFGLFAQFKAEETSMGSRLLSLYFLVPRGLVEEFRERFRNFELRKSAKVMLSGPWPPYNFVQGDVANPDIGDPGKYDGVGKLLLH